MKRVIALNELEKQWKAGADLKKLAAEHILTPSARDFLRAKLNGDRPELRGERQTGGQPPEPVVPDYEFRWTPGKDPQSAAEIERFFHSPEVTLLKERMVAMGKRMWAREYTDGNGGNLTIRVGDNLILCTPTLISKGFMEVEDICLVDLEGKQLAGTRKRTSEVMTHIGIMKRQPRAKACCHAHPPHGTAFAVAKVKPPTCLIPEAEVFLGEMGMAPYRTPGTPENADVVGETGIEHMAVLMENHGVITWGKDIEDAYWKMENVEAYCKTILLASQLGSDLAPITKGQTRELITLRKSLGMEDKRENWKECELCDNSEFRPGYVSCQMPSVPGSEGREAVIEAGPNEEAEAIVKAISQQIFELMKAGG